MKPEDQSRSRDELTRMLARCENAVAFTGAGISTECGVPDFRSPDSAWRRNKPIPFADFLAHEDMRLEAWRRKFVMDDLYADARPGRGHAALQRLATNGPLSAIITQNIDGLHQRSGVAEQNVIELHGNGTFAHCLKCGSRHELAGIRQEIASRGAPPICECGGIVKSATISFGQAMPKEAMHRARRATLACDLFIAIGSSLVVHPAASFPLIAKQNGALLIILNGETTPLDDQAELVLRSDIGDFLDPIWRDGVSLASATSIRRPQDNKKTTL